MRGKNKGPSGCKFTGCQCKQDKACPPLCMECPVISVYVHDLTRVKLVSRFATVQSRQYWGLRKLKCFPLSKVAQPKCKAPQNHLAPPPKQSFIQGSVPCRSKKEPQDQTALLQLCWIKSRVSRVQENKNRLSALSTLLMKSTLIPLPYCMSVDRSLTSQNHHGLLGNPIKTSDSFGKFFSV